MTENLHTVYDREYTPAHITRLNDGEIFVFGSVCKG